MLMANYNQLQQNHQPNGNIPGKGVGIAAFVVSMAAAAFTFFSLVLPFTLSRFASDTVKDAIAIVIILGPVLAFILSIIGLVLSSVSKKQGYNGGLRGAAFGVSLSFLIIDALAVVSILACVGCTLACMGLTWHETVEKLSDMVGKSNSFIPRIR